MQGRRQAGAEASRQRGVTRVPKETVGLPPALDSKANPTSPLRLGFWEISVAAATKGIIQSLAAARSSARMLRRAGRRSESALHPGTGKSPEDGASLPPPPPPGMDTPLEVAPLSRCPQDPLLPLSAKSKVVPSFAAGQPQGTECTLPFSKFPL